MARQLVLQNLMKLAQGIGANPQKFMGTRTNISFLGKGPTKNPLFQGPLRGIESATEAQLGPRENIIEAVEDAMGFASANKLNSIQIRALELNLQGLNKIYNPPPLPMASVSQLPTRGTGITGIQTQSTRGTVDLGQARLEKSLDDLGKKFGWKFTTKSKLPEPGTAGVTAALDQKTGMSRAIARQILQQDTRLNLKPEELYSLRTGAKGEDPIDLMVKYYGRSMENFDDFLNQVNLEAASPTEFAEMVLKHIKLTPQFAEGGLARILEV